MIKTNSQKLRATIAELETEASKTADAVTAAQAAYKAALRDAVLMPILPPPSDEAVQVAQQAHAQATRLLTEARDLLTETLAAEEAERQARVCEDVRDTTAAILAHAHEADGHLAAYVGSITRAIRLEADARLKVQAELPGRSASMSALLPSAVADAVGLLEALRRGAPVSLTPIAGDRAALGVRRIISGLGG